MSGPTRLTPKARSAAPALVALVLALLAVSLPPTALAQSDGPSSPVVSTRIASDMEAYPPATPVRLTVTNDGATRLEGNVTVAVALDCQDPSANCPPDAASLHVVWRRVLPDRDLPAGESFTLTWNRTLDSGDRAPVGRYFAVAQWHETLEARDTSDPFFLKAPDTNTPPHILIQSPTGDAVHAGTVPISLVVEDDGVLASVRVWLDDVLIAERTELGLARYEYANEHELEPGAHEVRVVARDGAGAVSQSHVVFHVGSGKDDGVLRLRTSQDRYGPDEPVLFVATNAGNATISGTPSMTIRDADGRTVWQPVGIQVVQDLKPGESRRFLWDQRNDDGRPAPAGGYLAQLEWGEARAETKFALGGDDPDAPFAIRLAAPLPGSAHRDGVTFEVHVPEPGVHELALVLRNGHSDLQASKVFEAPFAGTFTHRFDLQGAPAADYKALVTGRGPGGSAEAHTWFRVVHDRDHVPPALTLLHPSDSEVVSRNFPVLFEVVDDVGIQYAEAYLGETLVGRHAWPHPVMRGGFPVHVPVDQLGPSELRVVVYDAGRHQASERVDILVGPQLLPCASLEAQARSTAAATPPTAGSPGSNASALNASAELAFACPEPKAIRPPTTLQGLVRFAKIGDARLEDVDHDGKRLFDLVRADGDRPTPLSLKAEGRLLLLRGLEAGAIEVDLNSTWIASQRGGHVLLTNTADGTQYLLVIVGGEPSLLGRRLVADLGEDGHVVARPLGKGPVADRLTDGIVDGSIGAEVRIGRNAAEHTAVSYSDLNVTLTVDASRIEAVVSTPLHDGRTIVFTLEEGAPVSGELEVLLDGEVVPRGDSLEDVLDRRAGEGPEYTLIEEDGVTKVVLSIDHFSTREVVIQSLAFVEPFLTPLALFGGLAVIGAASFALLRRDEA